MNLTNKLLFPLLLIATLFTSACFDDTPAPKSGKEPCVAASECESNQCVQGLCAPTPKKLNDPCVTTSECKSPLVCLADKCANKPGDSSVADDGACTEDKECQAPGSTCKNDVCTAPADHSVADNGACSNTKQCSQPGSTCDANQCKPPAAHSVADKGACSDTVQCQYGSTCDTATNTCLAPADGSVAIGAMCAQDKQCKSETCDTTGTHTCKQHPDFGKNCSPSKTNECGAPLVCLGSLCAYEPGAHTVVDKGACTDTKQCQGASECSTTSHKCEPPAAPVTKVQKDQPCTATSQCDTDLVCLGKTGNKTCVDKPKDNSVPDGDYCTEDQQCKSVKCDFPAPGQEKVCMPLKKANFESCSSKNECLSGICDNSICVPKDNSVDFGDRCLKDSQCIGSYPLVCVTVKPQVSLCLLKCTDTSASESDCHKSATEFECKSLEKPESGTAFACEPPIAHKGESCANGEICDGKLVCNQSTHVCE